MPFSIYREQDQLWANNAMMYLDLDFSIDSFGEGVYTVFGDDKGMSITGAHGFSPSQLHSLSQSLCELQNLGSSLSSVLDVRKRIEVWKILQGFLLTTETPTPSRRRVLIADASRKLG